MTGIGKAATMRDQTLIWLLKKRANALTLFASKGSLRLVSGSGVDEVVNGASPVK